MEEKSHFPFLLVLQYTSLYMAILTQGTVVAAQINITTDQSALLALKSHITSDPHNILVNWSTTTSVCNWVGVTCGARHLRVASLNLSYMGFTGTIPPQLGNLSFLVALTFNNNSFHGTLPHELSYLRRLKLISFTYNNFMGSIPLWFGSFPKLQSFYLYGNQFSGSIPMTIFNLSTLQLLDLSNNQLSGGIPKEIRNLTMLKEIYLDSNKFNEIIPEEIGFLRHLENLFAQFNALKGHVPMAVFNMSSLTKLALYENSLSGDLPDNICQYLPSVQMLTLGRNQFNGPLPSKLWQCTKLLILYLEENNFNGSIPKNIGNLTMVKEINLDTNNLTEYGMEGIVSTRGDVYSFGIVVMETFTRRKPTDEIFCGEMNLKQWIANSLVLPDAMIDEVVDANLLGSGTEQEDDDHVKKRDCVSSIMRLALACCAESPEKRISMKEAVATLNKIKMKFLKDADAGGGVLLNRPLAQHFN